MNYAELTPGQLERYDGSMDPNTPEQLQGESSLPQDEAPKSAPTDEATKTLLSNYEGGKEEGDIAPQGADATKSRDIENSNLIDRRRTTKDYLAKLSHDLMRAQSPAEVAMGADQVLYAAKMVQRNKGNLTSKDLEKFNPDTAVERVEQIKRLLDSHKMTQGIIDRDAQIAERKSGMEYARQYVPELSQLASDLQNFFVREKIATEERDPYKPITSFEELMTKWVDVADVGFRPGEKFALIDVEETVDDFGRTILKETAHPDNFLRWVREKSWFYHDFDPYDNINLFQKLYLTVGFRTVSVYEMLVDVPTYFYQREPTLGEMEPLSREVLEMAEEKKTFTWVEGGQDVTKSGEVVGHYKIFNKGTGQFDEYTVEYELYDTGRGVIPGYRVLDSEGKPAQAILKDKDQWHAEEKSEYGKIKDKMLYEVWLLNESHNHDFSYRFDGMPTETKLKEVLAGINSKNLLTQDRKRLLGVLQMPATSRKEEIEAFMEGEMREKLGHSQGSVGKAVQRALAMDYHLSESSGAANEYKGLEHLNPFKQVAEKDGTEGSDLFYKSLIRQTIEANYPEKIQQAVRDLVDIMNGTIQLSPDLFNERFKAFGKAAQEEWERADSLDMVILGKGDLQESLKKRGFKNGNLLDSGLSILEKYYQEQIKLAFEKNDPEKAKEYEKRKKELGEFEASLNDSTLTRKQKFFEKFKKVKDGGFLTSDKMQGLDYFAVKFFAAAFDSFGATDTNIYGNINYDPRARKIVKQAIRDTIQQTEKLDNFEAKYAEDWAFVLSYHTGISARNDMQGIGHDAWSKIINTEFYRLRQTGGGNYFGNKDSLYGIHRLGVDFWQGMKVQQVGHSGYDKTLYETLTGLKEFQDANGRKSGNYTFDINEDIPDFDFHGNAQRQFVTDHVGHAIDLFIDITTKQEFNLDKIIKYDHAGRLTWNNEEMEKLINNTWKHSRYGLDNRQFLYDNIQYGWLYDETINKDGQVERKPHFGFMTLRQSMFSDKVSEFGMYGSMKNGKYKAGRKDVSSWTGESNYHTKMGRNVFAYLISMQLREHLRYSGGYRLYSAEEVEIITQAFMNYAAKVMKGMDGETITLAGFFTPEEIMKILVTGHAILWWLYMKEYSSSVGGGFLFGIFEAIGLVMKQAGAGIKL